MSVVKTMNSPNLDIKRGIAIKAKVRKTQNQENPLDLKLNIFFCSLSQIGIKFMSWLELTIIRLFPKTPQTPELKKAEGPKGFEFSCWLCSARSKFKCIPPSKTQEYMINCNMCGIQNKVRVAGK